MDYATRPSVQHQHVFAQVFFARKTKVSGAFPCVEFDEFDACFNNCRPLFTDITNPTNSKWVKKVDRAAPQIGVNSPEKQPSDKAFHISPRPRNVCSQKESISTEFGCTG